MDNGFVAAAIAVTDEEKASQDQLMKGGTGEIVRVRTGASELELPFSKARNVALVATVAAAPFLSVSLVTIMTLRCNSADYDSSDDGCPSVCHYLADYRRSS
jgi:hypothetical protein